MSDPQQSTPPSYYATTRLPETELPPAPEPPAKRGRGWLYAAIGAVLVIAIGAGFFVVLGRTLFQAQSSIPKLVGDDTQVYMSLTPNLSAIQGVERLRASYPQLFIEQDSSSIDKQLDEAMGVNFKDDIKPWLGREMAFAVSGLKEIKPEGGPLSESSAEQFAKDAKIAIILSSTDNDKAQAFLDKQRTGRGGKGQEFDKSEYKGVTIYAQKNSDRNPLTAFAMVQSYVVFASDTDTINTMIDRGADSKNTLEDSPRFKGVLDNLPKSRIAYTYIDGPALDTLFNSFMREPLGAMPDAQREQLEKQLSNIKALQGMGLAISVDPEGLQFDTAANFDTAKLDAEMKAQLEDAKTPADAERLKNISNRAAALFTFRIPSTFKDQVMKAIKAQENGEDGLQQMEDQTGLNLEHDILDWLAGDVSLVILPGEKLGDVTLPATGYLAIKPKDKAAAEAGVKKIHDVVEKFGEGQGIGFEEQQIGDVSWQVISEPDSQQAVGGYAFAKDELIIAFGKSTLESAGGKDAPITDDPNFKLVTDKLVKSNSGVFYLNVTSAVDMADQMGVGSEDSPEQAEFRKNIKPIKAIGFAAEPGLDQNGISRTRMFVYINDK
jgi:Protein of unknown function (DUF3352)